MNILHVNKFFYVKGGSEAYLFSLSEELEKRGHSVAEFAMEDPRNRPSKWSKYFIDAVDYETSSLPMKIRYATKIVYSFEARKKIAQLLDAFKPDIVHLHIFQHQISLSILPEIKRRGIPIVYTAHDLKSVCPNYKMLTHGNVCELCKSYRYYNCLRFKCVKDSYLKSFVNVIEMYFHFLRGYYNLIDIFITPSNFYRKKLIEFRFPQEKVVHIPNFVNEEEYTPNYGHDGYFIYLGRLSEEKGVLTLIEAMRSVTKGRLVIIGTGPMENQIKARIKDLNLSNVRMVGYQSGSALKKYISDSMFLVMPSEWYENGPISLLESFAYGKPVIGAKIGGIPEHIRDGEDGLIFESKNSMDLAQKINYLLDNPQEISRMGRQGRCNVERLYSKAVHMDAILGVYSNLLHKGGMS